MNAGPTRAADTELIGRSWASHPLLARVLRVVLVLTPAVASLVVTALASPYFYRPLGAMGVVLFVVQLGVLGFAVAVGVERVTRRLLPVANLLAMSLVFPDQAPSRFGVALRSGTTRQLEKEVQLFRRDGLSDDAAEAASQVLVLVNALGKHERLTRGHTERVRAYSELIGEEMGLSADDQNRLRWSALIHDVGKLAVPAPILSKEERLEDAEWRTIKLHPEVGSSLVEPLEDWLGEWRQAASEHHERWDGAGYPMGLAGTDISLAGRIVAVADTYDVITSTRSYKTAASAAEARKELVRCAGSQFDPEVVRAFLDVSVGRLHPVAGRFAWVANIGNAFQSAPVALQTLATGSAGAVGVTAAVVAGAVQLPPEMPPAAVEQAAPSPGSSAGRAVDPTTTLGAGEVAELGPPPTTVVTIDRAGFTFPSIPPEVSEPATATPTTSAGGGTTGSTTTTTTTGSPPPSGTGSTTSTTTPTSSTTSVPSSSTTSSTTTSTIPTTSTTSTTTSVPAGTDCERAQAGDTSLAGANLASCDLAGVDLRGADLTAADLTGAMLDNAILRDANLDTANLSGVSGVSLDLRNATLDKATLVGAFLPKAQLQSAEIQEADLRGAVFSNAFLYDTDLSDSDATGAVFDFADVSWTFFGWVNLTDASLLGAVGNPQAENTAIWSNTTCPDGTVRSTNCYR